MYRITLRQLEIFRAVAGEGSTAAAAQTLPLSQSAASAGLNQLERALGVRLFDRIGKRLALNADGRAMLPKALGILDNARQLESGASRSSVFELSIHASTTIGNYLVPKLLAGFRRSCPQGRVEARIGNTLEVVRAVEDFSAELGLIEGPCHDAGIVVTPWIRDQLVVVAAPEHPLARAARRRPLTVAQLATGPWLLRERGSGTRDAVDQALLSHIESFGEARILGSSEAIKNAAAFGLGVSCLSRWVVSDLVRAKRLAVLDTRLPPLERRLSLIWHREKTLSAGLHRFIEHCRALKPEVPRRAIAP
ncbi:MAG TPA: LysR family transcriptional regulator [Steroidobacteraceae bacterium]|jgi:DNA-binding transcriptional LysR family regulator|nr:LysR family transcriptional regulator [Steroidobacteraceae bacterium]